jgi:hypothetical protein
MLLRIAKRLRLKRFNQLLFGGVIDDYILSPDTTFYIVSPDGSKYITFPQDGDAGPFTNKFWDDASVWDDLTVFED